jgi:hypothetical protein
MATRSRLRSVVFTLNNYTQDEIKHIEDGPFKYIVFQQETGASGTPHLQGYASMANPTEFTSWKRLIGNRAFLEAARGTPQQNKAYCTKDAARIPGTLIFEKGDIPNPGARNDLDGLIEATKDTSMSLADIFNDFGPHFIRNYRGVQFARGLITEPRHHKTEVFWFYGSTGTGKSYTAHRMAPRAYGKNQSRWWCGYDPCQHDDVIIDEFRASFSPFSFLLQLFDENPLQVEFKGGTCHFRARRIFVTTPKSPLETWKDRTEEDVQQLLRRLTAVVEFLPGRIQRFVKGDASLLSGSGIVNVVEQSSELPVTQEEEVTSGGSLPSRVREFNGDDIPYASRRRIEDSDDEFLSELDNFFN